MRRDKEHEYCPRCNRPYSFIRFRYTNNKSENMCAECGSIERGEVKQNEQQLQSQQKQPEVDASHPIQLPIAHGNEESGVS